MEGARGGKQSGQHFNLPARVGRVGSMKVRETSEISIDEISGIQVQQEKIIRENRFQGGRKSALNGCNSHFHMYAKTPIRPLRGP